MKRILTLLLALCLIFGLSATAWAASETINITSPANGSTSGYSDKITFAGTIIGFDSNATYTLSCNGINLDLDSYGSFFCYVDAAKFSDNGIKTTKSLAFSLQKAGEGIVASDSNRTITIAAQPIITADDLTVSCGGHIHLLSTSGDTFSCTLETTCVNNTLTFSGSKQNLSISFDNSTKTVSSITAGGSYTNKVTVSNSIDTPKVYNLRVSRPADPLSSEKGLSLVELKTSANGSVITGTASASTTSRVNIEVDNAYSSVTVIATPKDTNATVSYSPQTVSGLVAGTAQNFTVTVKAQDNTTATYLYSVTRKAPAGDSSILSAVSIRTGNASSTAIASGSSQSGAGSQSLSISTSYASTTSAYVHWTLASGATLNSATWGGSSVSSGSYVTLPTSGNTTQLILSIKASNGTNYTATINVSRPSTGNSSILSAVSIRTGSASTSTAIASGSAQSGTAAQSIAIPASYASTTTAYVHWTIPSGATLSSATWGGSTVSSGGAVTLPTGSNTTQLVLKIKASDSSIYTATINVSRTTSTAILKSVTFTYSSSTLGSVSTISGTSTQSLNLNTSYTSANVSWSLADGATLVSAKWGSSSISSGSSVGLPSSGTTALVLTVKASNGTQYVATINVSKNGSTTATNTLDLLYVKNDVTTKTSSSYLFDLDPSFSKSKTSYTVDVDSEAEYIYIYPTPTSSSATVTVSGTYSDLTDRYSSSGYFRVKLRSSTNTVKVNVTANGTTTVYTLSIDYEDDVDRNASLSSLKVSKSSSSTSSSNLYDLSPSFSYSKTKYEVDIPKSVTTVYLHLDTYKSNATVTVSGATEDSDGVYKATLTTNKTKTVTIKVKYSSSNTTTYTVNLNNGSSSSSSYARLSKIRVASRESTSSSYQYTLLPSFDSSVTDYVALVPYSSSSSSYVYVQGTLDDEDDTLTIDGDELDSGEWAEISIKQGKSTAVPIKVKDDDKNTTTYNLSIVAAPKSADDDATLDSLSLRTGSSSSSAISLSPSFSSKTTSYSTSNVSNSEDSIRVYAEPNDSSAWVIVNDVLVKNDYATVDLEEGKNTIKVVVYAEDCETSKTYTITVNRGTSSSSDSTLSNLEVRYGSSSGQTLNLTPTFSKSITTYSVNVDGSVAQIAFRPVATDEAATIKIMGKEETSGQWTSYNALSNGSNTYLITVTSGDGKNTTYYTVGVERGVSVVVSPQKLKVNGSEVSCAAYNINGNNYFKLRDIAYALRGTTKSFDVTYNSSTRVISMTTGRNYSIIGGEMVKPLAAGKYQLSSQTVLLNGQSIKLTAYNVDGNNYFMLREIAALIDFGVSYDSGNSTMTVDSSIRYTPE